MVICHGIRELKMNDTIKTLLRGFALVWATFIMLGVFVGFLGAVYFIGGWIGLMFIVFTTASIIIAILDEEGHL